MEIKEAIINNKEMQRFEFKRDGELAEHVYRIRDYKMFLMHTWVPEALEGQGIATALIEAALKYSVNQGLELVAYCLFAREYIAKHPDWKNELTNN